jgi:hypothetical protein
MYPVHKIDDLRNLTPPARYRIQLHAGTKDYEIGIVHRLIRELGNIRFFGSIVFRRMFKYFKIWWHIRYSGPGRIFPVQKDNEIV